MGRTVCPSYPLMPFWRKAEKGAIASTNATGSTAARTNYRGPVTLSASHRPTGRPLVARGRGPCPHSDPLRATRRVILV
jgi:hypothetical protein